jgi:hypothetical protein
MCLGQNAQVVVGMEQAFVAIVVVVVGVVGVVFVALSVSLYVSVSLNVSASKCIVFAHRC